MIDQNTGSSPGDFDASIRSIRELLYIRITIIALFVLIGIAPIAQAYAQNDHGFRFVRVRYDDPRFEGSEERGWGRFRGDPGWRHDYPNAELNLHMAIDRTTSIYVEGEPIILRLSDDRIFDYPMLYLCEPGFWSMEEDDVENLREYLNRGGFVLFDDFGNEDEWIQLYEEMQRVFPDLEPRELSNDHPIWTIFYDIDPVEAPSLVGGYGRGGSRYMDKYLGYFDKNGRLMALACYNQDIGDGWEWPDRNLGEASTISFQMGINFLIYALTH